MSSDLSSSHPAPLPSPPPPDHLLRAILQLLADGAGTPLVLGAALRADGVRPPHLQGAVHIISSRQCQQASLGVRPAQLSILLQPDICVLCTQPGWHPPSTCWTAADRSYAAGTKASATHTMHLTMQAVLAQLRGPTWNMWPPFAAAVQYTIWCASASCPTCFSTCGRYVGGGGHIGNQPRGAMAVCTTSAAGDAYMQTSPQAWYAAHACTRKA